MFLNVKYPLGKTFLEGDVEKNYLAIGYFILMLLMIGTTP